jgi:hypothetical protein
MLTSESHAIKSKHTGKQYQIMIGLPHHYYDERSKKWPVVYLADSNWLFGMVTDIVRFMAWCKNTTDAIIVGIGYPQNKKAVRAGNEERFRRDFDFTPVRDDEFEKEDGKSLKQKVVTGGADQFLKFIQYELIPFVEKRYRVKPKRRILAGHSLGGLFAAYALFEKPRLFEKYIISSPSLWYHDKYLLKYEEKYCTDHKSLPANVYLSVGELEEDMEGFMATNMIRFGTCLKSHHYKGLSLVQKIFNGENHCEVIAPALQAGLKWALKE